MGFVHVLAFVAEKRKKIINKILKKTHIMSDFGEIYRKLGKL